MHYAISASPTAVAVPDEAPIMALPSPVSATALGGNGSWMTTMPKASHLSIIQPGRALRGGIQRRVNLLEA
jgi:hypothetical protein